MPRKEPKLKKKGVDTERRISADQPFDYEEVAAITGPDYVQNMGRNGIAVRPYEDLKKNVPGFKLVEDRCIWMKAGVINFRNCDYDNDCYNCPFDHAMRSAMGGKAPPVKKEMQTNWALQMEERYQITAKPCIHFQSGRLESPEECTGNYECYQCDVHRMLYPKNQAETIEKPNDEYKTDEYFELDLPVAPAIMVGDEIIVEGTDISKRKLEAAIKDRIP